MKISLNSFILFALVHALAVTSGCSSKSSKAEDTQEQRPTETVTFSYQDVAGIGRDSVYNRRDPSDIIKVNGKYYVYYTRMDSPVRSGYWGTIWYATSEDEGYTWQEQGMALGLGEAGAFDSHSVFTPNILVYNGKYYLYYTAVRPTPSNPEGKFEGNSTNDFTAIGVAVADSPDGPFERLPNNPVIAHSEVSSDFDSYRVDDASLLVRDGKIWLYYKGRCIEHGKKGPKLTEMGVAIADSPEGPFEKKGSLLDRGHEVLIWKEGEGVSCLASLSQSINHAADGLNFTMKYDSLENIPMAPGLYRPHLESGNPDVTTPGWGISMTQGRGYAYLMRFEMNKK
ncbi:family 43 glycosylhydrolase [Marinoscillum furvescens]|uniref:Glycosyl hydrolase family 43 n=1 Tax=Marinoscillum furvescens DSM 4134 TaxID=1122208 RepID=A0A3D9L3W1_MARFU|nr:family 43 glycosylhydrolase [Marinoscillum furvescens]REE00151.1 glycosyl hydrolase family 43 [Marinoscillum furvescens DSM 4134]